MAEAPVDAAAVAFQENFDTAFAAPTVDINAGYVLLSGMIVFFMQAGFCMLAAGSVRAKNARGIIMKNLLDSCVGAIVYYCLGWGFAGLLEGGQNGFIGTSQFALSGLDPALWYNWFFQFAFAAATCTIVSGALAERATLVSYLLYSVFLVGFVYPVVTHWIWSPSGWVSAFRVADEAGNVKSMVLGAGAIDFAGSGAVHMVGGYAAWAGAWVLGPRAGRFDADGKPVDMPGHNVALSVLGTFILWFGWYGFNPGSALMILNTSAVVARVAITTTLAGGAGGLTAMFAKMLLVHSAEKRQVWDLVATSNGALAGLVAITAPCSICTLYGAIIIGMIGGLAYLVGSSVITNVLKIDDPVDAIAVHAFAGTWGVLAPGFFATAEYVGQVYGVMPGTEGAQRHYGAFYGGGGHLLGAQFVYILALIAWVGGVMGIFFYAMKIAGIFRVPPEVEFEGADASHYGGSAYYGLVHSVENGIPVKGEMNGNGTSMDAVAKLQAQVAALEAKLDAFTTTKA